jgi:hypothetical protein
MSLESFRFLRPRGAVEALALFGWIAMTLAIVGRVAVARPESHSVYPVFKSAGQFWLTGHALYPLPGGDPGAPVYRYSPTAAALLVPFSLIPDPLGAILWRLVGEALFLGGLVWWLRTVVPRPLTSAQTAMLFLLVLPKVLHNLNNGQANLHVIGLLLIGVAAAMQDRWWLAAVVITLATYLKIYPIAIGLLLAAVYPRRFAGRLFLALLIGALLPFALQRPDYVWEQYHSWFRFLHLDDRSDFDVMWGYRDLRLLLRVWVGTPSPTAYLAIQLLGAAACAVVCVTAKLYDWPRRRLLTLLLALGSFWMTVLGPCTEVCTYIMMAPSAAWVVVEAWSARRPMIVHALIWIGLFLFTVSIVGLWQREMGWYFHKLGVHPLGGLMILAAVLVNEYYDWLERQSAPVDRIEPIRQAA